LLGLRRTFTSPTATYLFPVPNRSTHRASERFRMIEVKTRLQATGPWAVRGSGAKPDDRLRAPVLSARRGGPAERLGGALRNLHPAVVFVVLMLAGLAATALLSICLGFLVTHVLEPAWGIGAANERVNGWFAAHRTASRTDA